MVVVVLVLVLLVLSVVMVSIVAILGGGSSHQPQVEDYFKNGAGISTTDSD